MCACLCSNMSPSRWPPQSAFQANIKHQVDQHWPNLTQFGPTQAQHRPRRGPIGTQDGPTEAQDGATWPQMEPKRAPTSLNMAQDGASESPTCPQQGLKIVKHASALLISSVMSQNIVFPTVVAWFVAPSSAQYEPRWVPRGPKIAQENAKMGPIVSSWSQDEPNMSPRYSKMGQPKPT